MNPDPSTSTDILNKLGPDFFSQSFLLASCLWGAVAVGYIFYARKQREIVPFIGGIAMMAASFMVTSWLWMSLACIALMAGVYFVMKRTG